MSEDMSDLINKFSQMLKSNDMPNEIKNVINNLSSSNSDVSSKSAEDSELGSNSSPEFDINTMLKMKSIIDAMNKEKNDPRANLLKSLKPYLKESRKEKVDQYIQLFNMGKVFEILNPLGGEKKNDV